jgi:hypothetical protein
MVIASSDLILFCSRGDYIISHGPHVRLRRRQKSQWAAAIQLAPKAPPFGVLCSRPIISVNCVCMKDVTVDRKPTYGWCITVFICKCPCMICIDARNLLSTLLPQDRSHFSLTSSLPLYPLSLFYLFYLFLLQSFVSSFYPTYLPIAFLLLCRDFFLLLSYSLTSVLSTGG